VEASDPLADAILARRVAPELCAAGGCAWYHGTWPALHALGLAGTPERHAAFFDRAFREAIAGGRSRLLVCGTADAGMLGVALRAFDAAGVRPEATVLDRCPTPLRVSAEYARRAGLDVEQWVVDVFDAHRPGAFDLVCTHGLLAFIPDALRPEAVRRLAGLLAPGGMLLTTSSIAGDSAPDPTGFSAEAATAFAERARAGAAATPTLGVSPDQFAEAAREWASRVRSHPVRSPAGVCSLLEGGGFSIVEAEVMAHDGLLGERESGPWTSRRGRWVEVVARRD
jgi:hypothetical protein